ncbi:MAG: HAD-IIB family hydrolase [Spirochaetales bacterium]|nr:HAD-IIB family hydrolase [Spirochaetales bacterium]
MYIQMINIHGLLRGHNIEMGRDADTGGQTRYVLDLISYLSKIETVKQIDIFTRLIRDKAVSKDYSQKIEIINSKCRIIRLPCGGGKYLKKEKLWKHLDEFTDQLIGFIRQSGKIPDFIHGHYFDSGYIAGEIASVFGIPLIFSGHSLGRNKLKFLKESGWRDDEIESAFNLKYRINQEEKILSQSDLVVVSTNYEKESIYGDYHNCNIPNYKVIPPGLDLKKFFPYYDYELPGSQIDERYRQARVNMQKDLKRFHFNPDKPLILALCRPDARKNIELLIEAYGSDKELQAIANLAIFAGIRDNISKMEEVEKKVLTDILLLMDRYDLYGKMAIPKHHEPETDVPELYRLAAYSRGVFISTAFLENFGLTFIEASAVGLPFIATPLGGPKDIVKNCQSGLLVDISDKKIVANAIKTLLLDRNKWDTFSQNGINQVRKHYTWENHCKLYLKSLENISTHYSNAENFQVNIDQRIGRKIARFKKILISDIDDTLIGDDDSLEKLMEILTSKKDEIGFGIATGRYLESAIEILEKKGINNIDILITSVGTEIYYQDNFFQDKGWQAHLKKKWKPDKIIDILSSLNFISLQKDSHTQRQFKISYDLDQNSDQRESIPHIHYLLNKNHLAYNLILSHGSFIDILPYRASKGKAIAYLSNKWKIPIENIITAGNSGNDADMLTGNLNGIIVGNHEHELNNLEGSNKVFFSKKTYSEGIIDGLFHFGVI